MPDRYGDERQHPDDERRTLRAAQAIATQAAINRCTLCNPDGYRGTTVCDHTDHRPAAQRGMNLIRTIMGWDQPHPDVSQNPPKTP